MKYTPRAIASKWLIGNKKRTLIFIIISALSTLALFGTLIVNDGIIDTIEHKRISSFGSWRSAVYNADEKLLTILKKHEMIDSIGISEAYANLIINGEKSNLCLGTWDKKSIKMGNIQIIDGKLPTDIHDIAMEPKVLKELGYSEKLGQTISLDMEYKDPVTKEYIKIQRSFQLVGLLEDYKYRMKAGKFDLVSAIVSDKADLPSQEFLNLYLEYDIEYDEAKHNLDYIVKGPAKLVNNEYAYREYVNPRLMINRGKYDTVDFNYKLVLAVIMGTIICIVFHMLNVSISNRKYSLRMLKQIGATTGQIRGMVLYEVGYVFLMGTPIGLLLGIILPYIWIFFCKILFHIELAYKFRVENIYLALILSFGSFVFGSFYSFVMVNRIAGYKRKARANSGRRRRYSKLSRRLLIYKMSKRYRAVNKRNNWLNIWTATIAISVILAFGTAYTLRYNQAESFGGLSYGDYEYQYVFKDDFLIDINNDHLAELKTIKGINKVEAMRESEYFPITWNGMENNSYAKHIKERISSRYTDDGIIKGKVVSFVGEGSLFYSYKKKVTAGDISYEKFLSGEEVMIYLPLYFLTDKSISYIYTFARNNNPLGAEVFVEHTIKPGDMITIEGKNGPVSVKVGGVFEEYDYAISDLYPYSIIASDNFYKKISEPKDMDTYRRALISSNNHAPAEETEVELDNSKVGHGYINRKLINTNYALEVKYCVSYIIIVYLCIVTALAIVYFNSTEYEMSKEKNKSNRLKIVGMSKKQINWLYASDSIHYSIAAIILSIPTIFIAEIGQYYLYVEKEMRQFVFNDQGIVEIIKFIFSVFYDPIHFCTVGIIMGSFFVIHTILYILHIKKILNK